MDDGKLIFAPSDVDRVIRRLDVPLPPEEEGAEEEWAEPEVNDVEEQVWTEIREGGFGGNNVKNRGLRRIWTRRPR